MWESYIILLDIVQLLSNAMTRIIDVAEGIQRELC